MEGRENWGRSVVRVNCVVGVCCFVEVEMDNYMDCSGCYAARRLKNVTPVAFVAKYGNFVAYIVAATYAQSTLQSSTTLLRQPCNRLV